MQGKIIKNISNDYTVLCNQKEFICKGRGKFRNMNLTPLVGDNVIFDEKNNYILEILPRRNSLIRPPICNVDQAIIVTSVKNPNFDTYLLDKMLTLFSFHNVKPIICLTKLDLLTKEELKKIENIIAYYQKIGYDVYRNDQIKTFQNIFENRITVFTGQSGAGKSTLLNKLDSSLELKTNEISKALGRGKHTTRHVELLPILKGWIADTPGFSSLSFYEMKKEDIKDQFLEFEEYKTHCKYKDCMHIKEDDCEIKRKVNEEVILKSRYENYLHFVEKG